MNESGTRSGIDRFVKKNLALDDQFDAFGAKSVFRSLTLNMY